LEHYHYGYVAEYDTVTYYDVSIENQDGIVVMKGIMPYESEEDVGYKYGVSTYEINKSGLATSCTTIYPNDSTESLLEDYTTFGYKKNQLSEISNIHNYESLNYEGNDITYKVPDSTNGFVIVNTFINYTQKVNKSGLPLILESYLFHHRGASFAGILGRSTKHLPDRHAVAGGGGQLIYDYSYEEDIDSYVTSVTESRGSNVRMGFMGDLFSNTKSFKISYLEVRKPQ